MEEELDRLADIAKKNTIIKKMWVYGSRYKKTNRPDSDLDIAVEVEWVSGKMLGLCETTFSLWCAAEPNFKDEMASGCPWKLDLQLNAGEVETPNIHAYIKEASNQFYEKT